MTTAMNSLDPGSTRRWPRNHVNLPVLISVATEASTLAVPGLASEISRSGMALYGGVPLQPGDLMDVEFQTADKVRVTGIVRNRSGYCFGLEFLNLLTGSDAPASVFEPLSVPSSNDRPSTTWRHKLDLPWRTWLGKHRGDICIAISGALLLLVISGWDSRPAEQPKAPPSNPSQPSLTLSERILVSFGLAEPPPPSTLVGKPSVQVWVDIHTGLYYCSGMELYGKTAGGRLTTQRDAQLDQFEPAARIPCK
jgi:hypothetical protein